MGSAAEWKRQGRLQREAERDSLGSGDTPLRALVIRSYHESNSKPSELNPEDVFSPVYKILRTCNESSGTRAPDTLASLGGRVYE